MAAARELLELMGGEFGGGAVPEPQFSGRVPEFFRRVAMRLGQAREKARFVGEAVKRLEFAALRGEGLDRDREKKHVELIAEDGAKVPVFVATDADDEAVWQKLLSAHSIFDPRYRRSVLGALRAQVGLRVVEVPRNAALPPTDTLTGLPRVPCSDYARFYDLNTGWKRPPAK